MAERVYLIGGIVIGTLLAIATAVAEAVLTPTYLGPVRSPVAPILALAGNAGLVWFVWTVTRRAGLALIPGAVWFIVMIVAANRTSEGDLIITGTWVGVLTLLLGSVGWAVAGYRVILKRPIGANVATGPGLPPLGAPARGKKSPGPGPAGGGKSARSSQSAKFQGAKPRGAKSPDVKSPAAKSPDTKSAGAKSQGAESRMSQSGKSQGAKSQGAGSRMSQSGKSPGVKSQGAESQGAKSQGAKPAGAKAADATTGRAGRAKR